MNTIYAAYDEYAIWGTGNTEGRAREDAAQWVAHEHRDQVRWMMVAPMSKELADYVESNGGDVAFDLIDGVLQRDQNHSMHLLHPFNLEKLT